MAASISDTKKNPGTTKVTPGLAGKMEIGNFKLIAHNV
jgi:hypothetical protein